MQISHVGIVGAGTMGSGIATALAAHGFDASLFDQSPEAVAAASATAAKLFDRNVDKGRMTADAAQAAKSRIKAAGRLEDFAICDLLIEAVFENFDLKVELFRTLSGILRADALVATNTSCLRVSDLAQSMAGPERFLGLHYFSPAAVNPIVEVVRGEQTSPASMDAALAFTRAHGKKPITCKDTFGFAINRFFCPYTNEAARLLDEGVASTADIDVVAKDAVGAAAGPFLVMNLIKPRTNVNAIRNLVPLGEFYAPARSMIEHGDASRSFEIGEPGSLDAATAAMISDRLRAGTFLPVLQELDEAVAKPQELDLGASEALKFGKPPCALMDELGRSEVERILAPLLAQWSLPMPASIERVGRLTG